MPGVMDSVSTVNSLIRTLLAVVAVGAIGVAGWFGYSTYTSGGQALKDKERQLTEARNQIELKDQLLEEKQAALAKKDEEISDLNVEIKQQELQIQKLDTSLRLLKVNHRLAWLTVLDQGTDPETNETFTEVQFVEVDKNGRALDEAKQFRIRGDLVYIDNWVVKFDDKYVEQADIDRSTSLVLFRRIFGEAQKPMDGYPLDNIGARPKAYGQGEELSPFEEKIWTDFWGIANDEKKARELGIRAAHGEAPSIKVKKGMSYKIELRASDGLSITPDNGPPPAIRKPAA
jgi:hypothetical protein